MAVQNTLRARLEVLGGKELVEIFDKIGDSARKGFEKIDKEAAKATREVKKLERELKALDRISRNIRAKIKIEKGGTATPQQQAALGVADDIDRRTSEMRRQMAALDDALVLGRGQGLRVLDDNGERDLLRIRDATTALDAIVSDARTHNTFGDLIPVDDLERIASASARIRSENDRLFTGIHDRVDAIDTANASPTASPDVDRATSAEHTADVVTDARRDETVATVDADRTAERSATEREATEQRIAAARTRREDEDSARVKRDQDYRDAIARERVRIDQEVERSRAKMNADLADNRARLDREIQANRTALANERAAHQAELARTRTNNGNDIVAERNRANAAAATERTNHQSELARTRRQHTADLAAERHRAATDQATIHRDNANEITRLNAAHTSAMRTAQSDHLRLMGVERSRSLGQINHERTMFRNTIATDRANFTSLLARDAAAATSLLNSERLAHTSRLASERAANRATLLSDRAAHASALSIARADFAAEQARDRAAHRASLASQAADIARLNAALASLRSSYRGAASAGSSFAAGGPSISSAVKALGKTFSDAAGDLGKFGSAVKRLEAAIASTALRSAIAGILGALAGGLAALGGAAVLGGIAAIATLASFNAVKLKNAADAVGQSLDVFTALQYAAGAKGVGFDDYTQSLQSLNKVMMGVWKNADEFKANSALFKKFQIPLFAKDGKGLADARVVLGRLADIVKQLPNDTLRVEFLTNVGGADLAKLLPMLKGGAKEIDDASRRAMGLGVVLTDEQVKKMELLRLQFWDLWNVILGTAYKLAEKIMPTLIPLVNVITAWLLTNQDMIVGKMVATFDYLIEVVKDFWRLWNEGSKADVMHKWTATVAYSVEQVVKALKRIWNGISTGYKFAEPFLKKLSDYFGLSGPLEVAITMLVSALLGVNKLFLAMGGVGVAAARLVANVLLNTLGPIATGVLGTVASIIGWPLLLAAGIGAVIMYWNDIEGLFNKAWAKFKETFPQTAALLEKTFGAALERFKAFTSETVADFETKYPRITQMFRDVRGSLDELWQAVKVFDWGLLGDASLGALQLALDIMEKLGPLMDYLVTNTLQSIVTILREINGFWDRAKDAGAASGRLDQEMSMTPEAYANWLKLPGLTEIEKFNAQMKGQGTSIMDPIQRAGGRVNIVSPLSATSLGLQSDGPATQTPVTVNLSNGDTINFITPEENVADRLRSYNATKSAAAPSWR